MYDRKSNSERDGERHYLRLLRKSQDSVPERIATSNDLVIVSRSDLEDAIGQVKKVTGLERDSKTKAVIGATLLSAGIAGFVGLGYVAYDAYKRSVGEKLEQLAQVTVSGGEVIDKGLEIFGLNAQARREKIIQEAYGKIIAGNEKGYELLHQIIAEDQQRLEQLEKYLALTKKYENSVKVKLQHYADETGNLVIRLNELFGNHQHDSWLEGVNRI